MARGRHNGMNIGDTIGAIIVGAFLAVCLVGGFFNMGVQKSLGNEFVTLEEDAEIAPYEPADEANEDELAASNFVKAWEYNAEKTTSAWTRFVAQVCNLKGNTIELKEDGTAEAAIGEQEGEYFWRLKDDTHAILFDQEGNEHELVLEGDVLKANFISDGFAMTKAEEEEE